MTIFKRELVRNRKAFIIWTVSLVGLNALMMFMYPSIADQAETFKDMLENYPQGLSAVFGLDQLDISKVLDYFGMEAYLFITLFGSIYAMILGSSILSKEESDKTIEFLLSKPVTRNNIVTSKLLCTIFYIVLFNVVFALTNFIFFEAVKKEDYSMTAFLLISLGPVLMHLTFATIGFLVSVFIVKAKSIYPISIGVVLGTYFISIASAVSDKLENLKYLTPFQYVKATDLIKKESIDMVYLLIMAAVIGISISLAYVFYNKKDISV